MSRPVKHFISNVITAASIALLLLIIVIVTVQNRDLSEEVKRQTDINQRFLRCLILIPQDSITSPEQRVRAVDDCVTESRKPNGTAATPPDDNHRESVATPRLNGNKETTTVSASSFKLGGVPLSPPPANTPQNAPTQASEPEQPAPILDAERGFETRINPLNGKSEIRYYGTSIWVETDLL